METRSLKFIADACEGSLTRGSAEALVRRVNTDSRSTRSGDLFVALRGERFDGHDHLRDAATNGASALVVDRSKLVDQSVDVPRIEVADTRGALGLLGTAYRADFDLPTIAVCGSNGKTTSKELIASVLGQRFTTLKSPASFNNNIGVPMTLLELERRHETAVLEVGTNHPGELVPLLAMILPKYGVLTSIGREHLEFFGDLAGVADEEGALAEHLPDDGILFINGDSPESDRIIRRAGCRIVRVGLGCDADWQAGDIRVSAAGTRFSSKARNCTGGDVFEVRMPGVHHAVNALFAVALGFEFGLTREEIGVGLRECEPPSMRSRMEQVNGIWILNDAYNANADSMIAALHTLQAMECPGRRVAVLGDMAELGAYSHAAHVEAGRCVSECGIDKLVVVGRFAAVTADAAIGCGMTNVEIFDSANQAGSALKDWVREGDVVLVKASRTARLERVVEILTGQ